MYFWYEKPLFVFYRKKVLPFSIQYSFPCVNIQINPISHRVKRRSSASTHIRFTFKSCFQMYCLVNLSNYSFSLFHKKKKGKMQRKINPLMRVMLFFWNASYLHTHIKHKRNEKWIFFSYTKNSMQINAFGTENL